MSAELVEAAAVEAGISRSAIQRAMQEYGLVRAVGRSRKDAVVVELAVGPERVSTAVDSYLTDAGFAPVVRGAGTAIWEPAGRAGTRNAAGLVGVSRVTVSVTRGDTGGSTVVVNLDGRQRRLLHLGAASAGGAVMGVAGWAAAAGAWPMTVFVGGAGLALAISQTREATAVHRRRLGQAMVAMEKYLTGIEKL